MISIMVIITIITIIRSMVVPVGGRTANGAPIRRVSLDICYIIIRFNFIIIIMIYIYIYIYIHVIIIVIIVISIKHTLY